jgi:hypothetical protein
MDAADIQMAGRLCLAGLLGGLVGLEREIHSQPAGLRTHMIVSLGAGLIMLVSIHMADLSPGKSDPGRIAAQVVAGVGFLGAGAIMRSGLSVRGLTTAAACGRSPRSAWPWVGFRAPRGDDGADADRHLLFQKSNGFSKGAIRRFVVQARTPDPVARFEERRGAPAGRSARSTSADLVEKKLVSITAAARGNDMDS